jgi:PAS domain S-box-containing protein
MYLKSTLYTRWVIIFIVSATFWFVPSVDRVMIVTLLIVSVSYNIIVYIAGKKGIRIFTDRIVMIGLDGAMALLLIAYSGFTSSPYLFTMIFMIVSAAFWYGSKAIILIALLQSIALIILQRVLDSTPNPTNLLIQTSVLMTLGVYLSWLTRYERLERNQLMHIGSETEKERQRLSALINSVQDSVLVLDSENNIAIHNQSAAQLIGSKEELKGKALDSLLHFVDKDGQATDLKIKRSSITERKELSVVAADNSLVNMEISIAPYIVDSQNRGNVIIMHDTSEDKTIAQEREEFIAVASHELRTPLAIAESDISTLLSPHFIPQDKQSVSMLNGALRSLAQLSHIISDLTDLSTVENEKFEIEIEALNPIALLKEFQMDYADQAKEKNLVFNVGVTDTIEVPSIITSRYVVQEILTIFINNAIKFTESGSITVSLVPSSQKNGVTFSVKDTGIGISQSDQKNIFEKFFQSEYYASRVHGGTGLGLYIAQRLATRITAKIWFDSELDHGSTFYLWVPPYSKYDKDKKKVATAEVKDFFTNV